MSYLRHALRQLWKHPGFTAVAVLTLALGIGANALVFSVVKSVLLRPLGFAEVERMMWVRMANTQNGNASDSISFSEWQDIKASVQSLDAVALIGLPGVLWQRGEEKTELGALASTPELAEVLQVRPALGRMFTQVDMPASAPDVTLISHELWQTKFGGKPDVLGQTVRLEDKTHTIIGVLPPGLQFPMERAPILAIGSIVKAEPRHFWLPLRVHGHDRESREARMFLAIGRLKSGVSEAQAEAELLAFSQRLATDHPVANRHLDFHLLSFRDHILGQSRHGIPLLAGAVVGVLLICCVNLANLLLARGMARQREFAVRLALGAGRWHLVRALMTESLLLSLLGAGLGIFLAENGLQAVRAMAVSSVPFIREVTIDGAVIGFTLVLSVITAGMFGLLPALRLSRTGTIESLRSGTRTTSGPQVRAWQQGLLVGQITMVLVLLTASGLLLESFRRLLNQDLGYQTSSVITVDVGGRDFETNGDMCRMYQQLYRLLMGLPGVEAVGTVSSAPLANKWTFDERAKVLGADVPEAERPMLAAGFVAFDYFQALRIPLLEGRFFRDSELQDDGYGQIVIINEAAAKLMFPNRSAIGGRFTVGSNPDRELEIIGVVKDTRDERLEDKPRPRFYWQYAFGGAQIVVRSSVATHLLMPSLRETILQADSRLQVKSINSMKEIVSATVAERRFVMVMISAYALVALGIAAFGVFGVITCQVAQRTNEFGVRLALGASPRGLLRLVLTQAGRVLLIGLLMGLLVSLATNRLLASQLYNLSPHDPLLLLIVSVVVLGVGLLASVLPAYRAAKVDPMEALRAE